MTILAIDSKVSPKRQYLDVAHLIQLQSSEVLYLPTTVALCSIPKSHLTSSDGNFSPPPYAYKYNYVAYPNDTVCERICDDLQELRIVSVLYVA